MPIRGKPLLNAAVAPLDELVNSAGSSGLAMLFSLKHDFLTEVAS